MVVLMTDDQTVADLRGMSHTRALIAREGVRFKKLVRLVSALLPVAGHLPHRPLPAQPQGARPLPTDRRLRPLRQGATRCRSGCTRPATTRRTSANSSTATAATRRPTCRPGWNEWYGAVDPTTYRMWGYTLNENGDQAHVRLAFRRGPASLPDRCLPPEGGRLHRRAALTSRTRSSSRSGSSRRTTRKLRSATRRAAPYAPPPATRARRARAPLPRPRSFDEPDISDKPAFRRRHSPRLTPAAIAEITANYRARQESLLAVDEAVRDIVGSLERNGVLDNTYILFTSDNGFLQGEHRVHVREDARLRPVDWRSAADARSGHPARRRVERARDQRGPDADDPRYRARQGRQRRRRSLARPLRARPGEALAPAAAARDRWPQARDDSRAGHRAVHPAEADSHATRPCAPSATCGSSTATAPASCTTSHAIRPSCIRCTRTGATPPCARCSTARPSGSRAAVAHRAAPRPGASPAPRADPPRLFRRERFSAATYGGQPDHRRLGGL